MFSQLFAKISTFANHHQAMIAGVVTLGFVCVTWGIEKILERYIFSGSSLAGYIAAIGLGLLLLWITQHYILHVI
jgi:uncharacterized membrane protein YjjP (DUF1212 family)